MDDGRLGDEMTLEGIAKQLADIRSDLGGVKADLGGVKTDLGTLKGDIKALDTKVDMFERTMKIEFDETRSMVKLGFENVQMLDEKIDRRFDKTDRANTDNTSLLEAAMVRLRRDIEAPDGPALRRRR